MTMIVGITTHSRPEFLNKWPVVALPRSDFDNCVTDSMLAEVVGELPAVVDGLSMAP